MMTRTDALRIQRNVEARLHGGLRSSCVEPSLVGEFLDNSFLALFASKRTWVDGAVVADPSWPLLEVQLGHSV